MGLFWGSRATSVGPRGRRRCVSHSRKASRTRTHVCVGGEGDAQHVRIRIIRQTRSCTSSCAVAPCRSSNIACVWFKLNAALHASWKKGQHALAPTEVHDARRILLARDLLSSPWIPLLENFATRRFRGSVGRTSDPSTGSVETPPRGGFATRRFRGCIGRTGNLSTASDETPPENQT